MNSWGIVNQSLLEAELATFIKYPLYPMIYPFPNAKLPVRRVKFLASF